MPSAGPLPESRFSSWSPSPRSSAATSSRPLTDPPPQEDIVHPLSRPTSQTSFVDHHKDQSLEPILSKAHQPVPSTVSVPNREDPASVPPWPQRAPSSSSQLAFYSVSSPHDTSSVPSSPTTTSPALSSYRDMPSFPFLRRANSTTSIPVLPPFVDSTSSLSLFGPSRKLLADPLASASTSDLPSLGSFSRPRSPTPLSGPPAHAPSRTGRALDRGTSAAIGPKAGARLLASREAQRAVRDAELVAAAAAAGQGDDEFSIREQLASGMVRAASPEGLPPAVAPRNVGVAHTASGSSSERLVPRVPVPSLEKEDGHHRREEVRREKPSQESGEQGHHDDKTRAHGRDEGTPRQRPSTSSKAADKGYPSLSSPIRPPRRPPVAGLNAATADSGPSPSPRQRSSSTGSTASLSKDVVLSQLAEAVRREKKKSEMYQRECEQGEKEVRRLLVGVSLFVRAGADSLPSPAQLAEIAGNLEVLKEKCVGPLPFRPGQPPANSRAARFATSLAQQEQVIANLEAEIDELESELEMANDLDEEVRPFRLRPVSCAETDARRACRLRASTLSSSRRRPRSRRSRSRDPSSAPLTSTHFARPLALRPRRTDPPRSRSPSASLSPFAGASASSAASTRTSRRTTRSRVTRRCPSRRCPRGPRPSPVLPAQPTQGQPARASSASHARRPRSRPFPRPSQRASRPRAGPPRTEASRRAAVRRLLPPRPSSLPPSRGTCPSSCSPAAPRASRPRSSGRRRPWRACRVRASLAGAGRAASRTVSARTAASRGGRTPLRLCRARGTAMGARRGRGSGASRRACRGRCGCVRRASSSLSGSAHAGLMNRRLQSFRRTRPLRGRAALGRARHREARASSNGCRGAWLNSSRSFTGDSLCRFSSASVKARDARL